MKLEKQYRISEKRDQDFDDQFEVKNQAEILTKSSATSHIHQKTKLNSTGQDWQIDILDLVAVLKSIEEKALGQSGITRRYLRKMPLELKLYLV